MLTLAGSGSEQSRSLAVGRVTRPPTAAGHELLTWDEYIPEGHLKPSSKLVDALTRHTSILVIVPIYCGTPAAECLGAFQALHEHETAMKQLARKRLGMVGVSTGQSGRECLQPLASLSKSLGLWVDPGMMLLCDDMFIGPRLADPQALLELDRLASRLRALEGDAP
ncbi:hypothetical protein [Streptomyces sp. NPDC050988]|uniref:hypothetical protein n=1 Tax=Streptomyces sp. NPDC050988 TaxID=3365637 RepID=UPI003799830B